MRLMARQAADALDVLGARAATRVGGLRRFERAALSPWRAGGVLVRCPSDRPGDGRRVHGWPAGGSAQVQERECTAAAGKGLHGAAGRVPGVLGGRAGNFRRRRRQVGALVTLAARRRRRPAGIEAHSHQARSVERRAAAGAAVIGPGRAKREATRSDHGPDPAPPQFSGVQPFLRRSRPPVKPSPRTWRRSCANSCDSAALPRVGDMSSAPGGAPCRAPSRAGVRACGRALQAWATDGRLAGERGGHAKQRCAAQMAAARHPPPGALGLLSSWQHRCAWASWGSRRRAPTKIPASAALQMSVCGQ